jgi:mRNA-degrading endonuclease RelE of RelBE toxin-antitoxin system
MQPEDWLRFVDLPPFERQFPALGLDDDAHRVLEATIMADPKSAPVIKGSGGLRKLRFAGPGSNRGKRGSYRVFYVYFEEYGTVLLLAILEKSQAEDISREQLSQISAFISRIKYQLDQGNIQ